MRTFLLLCILSVAGLFTAEAQDTPYRIEVEVNPLRDTTLILGHYFNKQMYVNDTARINSKGVAVFEGKEALPGGIYVVYLPNKKYFDLLIDKDQTFTVYVDTTDFINSMQVEGAEQPGLFNQYQRFIVKQQKKAQALQQQLQSQQGDAAKQQSIQQQLEAVTREVKQYWDHLTQNHPGTMLALFVKGIQDVPMPEMKPPAGSANPDSALKIMQYNYYKAHYFDHIDFTDRRILRTPFFANRLDTYFEKVLIQAPDTILNRSIQLIEKSREDTEVFRYLVQYLFNRANDSQIMGMDAVVVGLAEKYYLAGETPWANEKFLDELAQRVKELKPTLIGQKAHDLKMPSLQGEYYRLHEINAPVTLLVFWEPECGHCKKEIPALHELYKEQLADKGVKIFSVYTQFDKEEWSSFIDEYQLYDFINVYDPNYETFFRGHYDIKSTPVIYVLNRNKEIIGKRIAVKDLPGFIDHYLSLTPAISKACLPEALRQGEGERGDGQ